MDETLAGATVGADAERILPLDLQEIGDQIEETGDLGVLHAALQLPRGRISSSPTCSLLSYRREDANAHAAVTRGRANGAGSPPSRVPWRPKPPKERRAPDPSATSPTDEVIAPDPEAPRLVHPLPRVVDADAPADGDGRGRDPPATFFDPGAIAE